MNRTVTLAIATLIYGIAWVGTAIAETAKDFVGTWTLVSATTEQAATNRTRLVLMQRASWCSTTTADM